jgi:hypothetical protein
MIAARTISQFLTAPGKVAHALDWKKYSGNILNLIISKGKIEMAVASHPEFQEKVRLLNPVPILQQTTISANDTTTSHHRRRILDSSVPETLAAVMEKYNVCGIIVGWPVEREGWCGASCGRVLYTLDQLVQANSSDHGRVITMNRPICLYDMDHHIPDEDEWGRSPVYSEISYDSVQVCSEEQSYHNFCATHAYAVTSLWNDFCTTQWPQLSNRLRSGYASSNTALYHQESPPQYGEDEDDWEYGHDDATNNSNAVNEFQYSDDNNTRNYRPAA